MNQRGQYGVVAARTVGSPRAVYARALYPREYPRAYVGVTLFHGISDRDTAGAALDAQIVAITKAVVKAAGGDPDLIRYRDRGPLPEHFIQRAQESRARMEKSPLLPLFDDVVSPMLAEWNSFYEDRHHWYDAVTEVFTSWEDYEAWVARVNELRAKVEAAGVRINLPGLRPPPRSVQDVLESGASSIASGAGDIFKIVKWGIIAALGIGGAVALGSLAHNLRTGTDPAEKYLALARDRSRAARDVEVMG